MAHKIPTVTCAEENCRAEFVYLENPATGARVPVDVDSLSEDEIAVLELTGRTVDVSFDKARHVNHFLTCTNPRRFSSRKAKP